MDMRASIFAVIGAFSALPWLWVEVGSGILVPVSGLPALCVGVRGWRLGVRC